MREANELTQAVIQLGTMRGAFLWRNNTGRRGNVSFGKIGSGDVIGVYRGYFISLETKTQNDRASDEQIHFMAEVISRGGFAWFIRSIDDAVELFDVIDKKEDERNGSPSIPF